MDPFGTTENFKKGFVFDNIIRNYVDDNVIE